MSALERAGSAQDWLTIREASSLVGVSVATMRRWCDAGEVRAAFTTPGGHRRFERSAVLGLARVANDRGASVGCRGETRIRMLRAYRREMRLGLDSSAAGLSEDIRSRLRDQGARIVGELISVLDTSPRDALQHSAAARDAATQCGLAAAECGMSLDATIALFIRLRAPFIHQLGVVLRGQARDAADTTAVLETASDAFDQLLPAMVRGFETGRSAPIG